MTGWHFFLYGIILDTESILINQFNHKNLTNEYTYKTFSR